MKILLMLVLLLGCAVCSAQADQPIVIKFSHVVTADTPKGRAAELFRMRAEELTKGRVRIEVYPYATLFSDNDEMAALQQGKVQMLAPALSKFGAAGAKEFEVFDTPYLFRNRQTVQSVLAGPVGKELFRKLEPIGIKGLAYWDNGFKVMSSNHPLLMPADMRGMKVRIQSSKVIDAQMRTLGAVPQVLNLVDTFAALKAGTVDGTENPPSNMYSQRMHEVQRYAIDTNHGYLGYAVIANKQFWDGLPPDIRAALEQALRDATRYCNSVSQQGNDDALAVIEKSGKTKVTHLNEAQRNAWQQALLPVRKDAEARVGADFMNMMLHELSAAESRR